jgi:hypothetical protein
MEGPNFYMGVNPDKSLTTQTLLSRAGAKGRQIAGKVSDFASKFPLKTVGRVLPHVAMPIQVARLAEALPSQAEFVSKVEDGQLQPRSMAGFAAEKPKDKFVRNPNITNPDNRIGGKNSLQSQELFRRSIAQLPDRGDTVGNSPGNIRRLDPEQYMGPGAKQVTPQMVQDQAAFGYTDAIGLPGETPATRPQMPRFGESPVPGAYSRAMAEAVGYQNARRVTMPDGSIEDTHNIRPPSEPQGMSPWERMLRAPGSPLAKEYAKARFSAPPDASNARKEKAARSDANYREFLSRFGGDEIKADLMTSMIDRGQDVFKRLKIISNRGTMNDAEKSTLSDAFQVAYAQLLSSGDRTFWPNIPVTTEALIQQVAHNLKDPTAEE